MPFKPLKLSVIAMVVLYALLMIPVTSWLNLLSMLFVRNALAFGLMHMNFNQFCYAFVLGIAFGILLEATGSIFATMTAHFVINGWSTVLMAVSKLLTRIDSSGSSAASGADTQLTTQMMISAINVYSVIAAICIFAAAVIVVIYMILRG